MTHLFDITYLLTNYGYIGILFIVFLESGIFFPLPGDSLIFTAGLLSSAFHFNIILLTFLVFIAAFLGGVAGYYIGTKVEYLKRYGLFRKMLKKEYIDQTDTFLKKHGLSALLLCRFIPIARTFLPIVAGVAHMEYKSFIKYSLIGSFLWSAVFTLGGYFLGAIFPNLQDYLLIIIIVVVVLSILPGVFHYLKHRKIL